MENVIQISAAPQVFNPVFVMRLAEANKAVRQLRDYGCSILSQVIGDREKPTEIVVDRNPHKTLIGCPSVHVTCVRRWQ
jgi:hypothetical protein